MRIPGRYVAGLLAAALALSACEATSRATPRPSSAPTEPPAATPTPTMPTDLTPITVSGTPVIIPSAIEFTPSPPPAPAPTSTGPSITATGAADPQVFDFQVTPQDGLDFGKTVTVSWDVEAEAGTLNYTYVTGPAGTSSGDTFSLDTMKGSRQITLRRVDALPLYVEFTLEATNGVTDPQFGGLIKAISRIQAPVRCPYPWFFDNPPVWCPLAPDTPHEGIAQRFEHAQMIGTASQMTVLFSEPNFWASYNVVEAGPVGDTAGVDPAFYGQWRDGLFDNVQLKNAVGKPLGAAVHYTAHAQCEFLPQHNLISECFLNLPDGKVIRLYQHGAYGRNGITWREWTGPAS